MIDPRLITVVRRPIAMCNSLCDGWPWRARGEPWGSGWDQMDWSDAWVDPGPSPAGNRGPYPKVARPYPGDYNEDGTPRASRHRVYSTAKPGERMYAVGYVRRLVSVMPEPCSEVTQDEAMRMGYTSAVDFARSWAARYGGRAMQWVYRGSYSIAVPPLWVWRYEFESI